MHRSIAHLIVGSVAWLCAVGCAERGTPPPTSNVACTEPPGATTQPVVVDDRGNDAAHNDTDRDVLDVVWNDLLTERKSPLSASDTPPAEILLFAKPSSYPRKAEEVLMRHDQKLWDALTPAQLAAATDGAAALVRRHERGDALPASPPRDARVKIHTNLAATRPNPLDLTTPRPALAYPPGYASDGKVAVVSLILPWSMHHADATYILARDGHGWKIILRQFVYYV